MSPLNITQPYPTIRYMVYNGYYKVMFNIPKMGQLPTPVIGDTLLQKDIVAANRKKGILFLSLIC